MSTTHDNGIATSEKLAEDFLATIPEKEKARLLSTSEKLSPSIEAAWKAFGHTPGWTDTAHIETGRNVNYPEDKSVYSRRNAHCSCCGYDMWLIVENSKVVVYGGGTHQCTSKEH